MRLLQGSTRSTCPCTVTTYWVLLMIRRSHVIKRLEFVITSSYIYIYSWRTFFLFFQAFADHSDLVARRMGFIPIPLGVVMIKVLTRCVTIDGRLASIILLLFAFTCLVTLKTVNLVYILGRACKLIDLHKTVCDLYIYPATKCLLIFSRIKIEFCF